MTLEEQSKVVDAVKMVLDRIAHMPPLDKAIESDFIERLKLYTGHLFDASCKDEMAAQGRYAKEIAAVSILYMVKFL